MISQSSTRVQAIKNKFENLGEPLPSKSQLCKQQNENTEPCSSKNKENKNTNCNKTTESSDSDWSPKASPNTSYLYSKGDVKRNLSDSKKSLTRQISDPGKKLHRSHAFRCDRSQKIVSPKRHGSCYGRSESGDFTLKMGEKKLSKDRLKKLGNLLEDQMKKEGFVPASSLQTSKEVNYQRDESGFVPTSSLQTSKEVNYQRDESGFVPTSSLQTSKEVNYQRDESGFVTASSLRVNKEFGDQNDEVNNCIEDSNEVLMPINSIPDSQVPQHILDQYAKVIKPRKIDESHEKQDVMTDSGVSSETENGEDEKLNKVKKLLSQFEKNDSTDSEKSNLELMTEFCASSDTIKLERKNPHIKITDTLKKALKQPLPVGPPPKKPPRTFASIPESPEKQKKDTKKMLEKLEQVLLKREAANQGTLKNVNEYDTAEADLSLKRSDYSMNLEKKESSFDKTETLTLKKPKEIHYLCTEIIDIPHRQLVPNQLSLNSCFKSLNCAIVPNTNSTLSLPYTRLSTGSKISENFCSCSAENLNRRLSTFSADNCSKCDSKVENLNQNRRLSTFSADNCSKCDSKDGKRDTFSTFLNDKCSKCQINDEKHGFKCHLSCKCRGEKANFFVEKEHIYDIPFIGNDDIATLRSKASVYGSLNQSKSMEDLRTACSDEDQKIYDIPCEVSRPATPEVPEDSPVDTSPKITSFTEKAKENSPKTTSFGGKTKETSPKIISFSEKVDDKSPKFTSFAETSQKYKTTRGHKSSESGKRSTSFDTSPKSVQNGPKIVDVSPKSPEKRTKSVQKPTKLEFQKLRQSFESGFQKTDDRSTKFESVSTSPISDSEKSPKIDLQNVTERTNISAIEVKKLEKPPMKPKPIFIKNKMSKSSENLIDDLKKDTSKRDKRFSTDGRRYRRDRDASSLAKKDNTQLDVDRENLNRLMNEIYATVTAADEMDNKPSSFPTHGEDGSTSEDSVKLTRSLTEKRKNYVRRVSSKVAYLDQKNRTRFRHQTSVCSYKSEIIDNNPYNTFRSWKSFRTSQKNLNKMADNRSMDSKCNLTDSAGNLLSMKDDFDTFDSSSIDKSSIDEKTGCVDIELPFEPRERGLFNVCLLVGLNYMTGQAYVKSVFPSQVQVPPHIENLIFPETLSDAREGWTADGKGTQCYSLVLTDERGERSYGYCRRVLPEGATTCLPLCYCLIGKYRAPGFYYKVLQEIESHHGSSEDEIHSILQQLFETDFPNSGEDISITYKPTNDLNRTINYDLRKSINLGDINKCKTLPNMRRSLGKSDAKFTKSDAKVTEKCKSDAKVTESDTKVTKDGFKVTDTSGKCKSESNKDLSTSEMFIRSESASNRWQFHDLENYEHKQVLLSVDGFRTKTIKRPIEPRIDEDNMSTLLDSLGAGLTIKVFSSLLLERKVLVIGNQLSQVSSCMEALQSALYPFVWQQPLISIIPAEIQRDVLEAPLPILAGMLKIGDLDTSGVSFEEGMLIDLTYPSKVLFYQGDESTILPTSSYKSLKTSLQMESKKQDDDKTRNVLISEAFMRFFVDILGDFWRFFHKGELTDGMLGKGDVIFDKESFIKASSSKQNQYFLEWFTETAMFNHFIQNMATEFNNNISENSLTSMGFVDSPLPDFYDLFQDRVSNRKIVRKNSVSEKNNYKLAVNKKVKLLKTKLRELVT